MHGSVAAAYHGSMKYRSKHGVVVSLMREKKNNNRWHAAAWHV